MPISALRLPFLRLLLLVCVGATVTTLVSGTDHIVGANRGWNPGFNYTLWANNHTFYVGDLISFRYQKNQYNVFEVNQTDYDNCTTYGAVGNWSSGKDFIPLDKAKRYYFICPNGCYNGMKVSVLVHPLPSSPTAAVSSNHSSSHDSSSQDVFRPGLSILGALLVSLASIWV
ncbi:PREDICTED: lamin-like protein [Nelumbo nucifera]|uniref:Lamin-like protein n=2 Tax=Nelumbo nucifera TaxID=4432 RepID=A0A1U8AS09_NELNU|nr:PREDICTED: lamin-like protein [Nelumbo nucifera]DAD27445.1 TPA_asm: hypothetical protein HUJ06_028914 [Nelumbo nucifera]